MEGSVDDGKEGGDGGVGCKEWPHRKAVPNKAMFVQWCCTKTTITRHTNSWDETLQYMWVYSPSTAVYSSVNLTLRVQSIGNVSHIMEK